ncbi:MAG: ABC transporter ATP-binding protein [Deltaproteobacteria bacterium]|nr:ABC transporter ATP-binding protein [Deltaproteobacteria bacterium]
MLVCETGQAICQIMVPYIIKRLIDEGSNVTGSFQDALIQLKPTMLIFLGLSLGTLIFSRLSGAILVMTGATLRKRVRSTAFKYLQFHSQRFFITNFAGSLANRLNEVSMGVSRTAFTILFDFWPVLITFSTSLYLIFQAHSTIALVLGVWTVFYIVISFALASKCRVYANEFANKRSLVSGKIVDSVTNSLNTKLFAKSNFERKHLDYYLDVEVKAAQKTFWFMEYMRWFQSIATLFLQAFMIVLSLYYWVHGKISIGAFAMITSLALMLINQALGLSRRFLEFFEYIGNIAEGVRMIVKPHEVTDIKDAPALRVTRGEIVFHDVCFSYANEKPIFNNLNIRIAPGQRVGLVGFSGSGKTTFTNLILRMYNIQSGVISIDGQDIAKYSQESLRDQISMIPQEPMLFHRTLLDNIRYGKEQATDEEVFAAAQAAQAHDFIMQLPDGYQAYVGERGVKLSGGQRQRIAIARAILKNAPILALDEATSSLDSITEKAIQHSLEHVMKNHTVLVVAHRLSTISQLDRIIVFDQGKVVEDGPHAKLLQDGKFYARLWSMQVGGFLPQSEFDLRAAPRQEIKI